MQIHYRVPFKRFRKIARTYCKASVAWSKPFIKNRKLLKNIHAKGWDVDYREIPVIINNYNRLEWVKELINWLEKAGMKNLFILDNASTFPPLLAYYETTKHTVIRLNANIGYKAIWDTKVHLWFKDLPYIYTDPDVMPLATCPLDVVDYFKKILMESDEITKVGFGLKIDDIPDFYPQKDQVLEWESKHWNNPIAENLYKADIDTTFALYKPNCKGQQWGRTLRTGGVYQLQHLPWYQNPNHLSEEEQNYRRLAVTSTWY